MKKFTNKTNQLRTVSFTDGTAQFLMRGQSFVSDKQIVKVQDGVVVTDVPQPASKRKSDPVVEAE